MNNSKLHKTVELSNLNDDPTNRTMLKKSNHDQSFDPLKNLNEGRNDHQGEASHVIYLNVEKIVDANKMIRIVSISLLFAFGTISWYAFQMLKQLCKIEMIQLSVPIALDYFSTIITMILYIKYIIEIKLLEKENKKNEYYDKEKDTAFIDKLDFIVKWRFFEWYLKYVNYFVVLLLSSDISYLFFSKLILLFCNWCLYQWLKIMHQAARTKKVLKLE